jgi:hypothetical protein
MHGWLVAGSERSPDGLAKVVAAGDRRASLEALRDFLAARLEAVDPDKTAPLAKQLADVLRELSTLAVPKGSKVDDLAAKRAARRSGAKNPESPTARDRRRRPGSD